MSNISVGNMFVSKKECDGGIFLITSQGNDTLTGIFLTKAANATNGRDITAEVLKDLTAKKVIDKPEEVARPILIGGDLIVPGYSLCHDNIPEPTMITTDVECRSNFQIHRGYPACKILKGTEAKILTIGEIRVSESHIQKRVDQGVWYSPLPITRAILDAPADQRWNKAREMIRALT